MTKAAQRTRPHTLVIVFTAIGALLAMYSVFHYVSAPVDLKAKMKASGGKSLVKKNANPHEHGHLLSESVKTTKPVDPHYHLTGSFVQFDDAPKVGFFGDLSERAKLGLLPGVSDRSYSRWFPELFSSVGGRQTEDGAFGGCTAPVQTEDGRSLGRHPSRRMKGIAKSLFNPDFKSLDDLADTLLISTNPRSGATAPGGRSGERGNQSQVVFRTPFNDLIPRDMLLNEFYRIRSLASEAERTAALQELKAKRPPHNPWVEARSLVARYQSDPAANWKKDSIVHYLSSVYATGSTMCTRFAQTKAAVKEEMRRANMEFLTALLSATGPKGKEALQRSGVSDTVLTALFSPTDSEKVDNAPGVALGEQGALLSKVRVWDPSCTMQRLTALTDDVKKTAGEKAVATLLMNRPTLLCVVSTFFRKLRLAILQHQLWGYQCDEFLIFVTDGHKRFDRRAKEKLEAELSTLDVPLDISRIVFLKPTFGQQDEAEEVRLLNAQDDSLLWEEASLGGRVNQWQSHREIISFLTSWHMTTQFDYFYFGYEDTYLIPENLYRLLTVEPEYWILNQMGTPLYLGNRMLVPDTKVPFASGAGGYVLNAHALKLRQELLNHDACYPTAVSLNDDVLLAKCFQVLGVEVKDTSDELGEDRFSAISVEWLIRTSNTPQSSWWYPSYRPRGMPSGFSAANMFAGAFTTPAQAATMAVARSIQSISSSAITFSYVASPQKAIWLHRRLFGSLLP